MLIPCLRSDFPGMKLPHETLKTLPGGLAKEPQGQGAGSLGRGGLSLKLQGHLGEFYLCS